MYTLGICCLSIGIKPTELYHRYPFMPPTCTERYHVQVTQFELYHVYPKLAPTGQKILVHDIPGITLWSAYTLYIPGTNPNQQSYLIGIRFQMSGWFKTYFRMVGYFRGPLNDSWQNHSKRLYQPWRIKAFKLKFRPASQSAIWKVGMYVIQPSSWLCMKGDVYKVSCNLNTSPNRLYQLINMLYMQMIHGLCDMNITSHIEILCILYNEECI